VTADAIRSGIVVSRRRQRAALATEYAAPNGQLESDAEAIVGESLGIDRVGVDDDFFELGGTSLQAAMLANTMQGALKRPFDSLSVFESSDGQCHGTPARARDGGRTHSDRCGGGKLREGPLSPAQQRLLVLDQFNSGSVVYNEGRAVRLTGVLDGLALEKAFATLIARHECLRTSFPVFDGRAVQRVEPPQPFCFRWWSSGIAQGLRSSTKPAGAWDKELARPFDLAAGPPFRAGLFRLAERDHVLWLAFHHIVADGLSVRILFRELARSTTRSWRNDRPISRTCQSSISTSPAGSATRSTASASRTTAPTGNTSFAGKLPPLQLPADRPRPAVLTYNGSRLPFKIPKHVVEALRADWSARASHLVHDADGRFASSPIPPQRAGGCDRRFPECKPRPPRA